MSALVVKSWIVSNSPVDSEHNYIVISARRGGLISWLLALARVSPTTFLKVNLDRVEMHQASFGGTDTRIIPLVCISSISYGYVRPWRFALAIIFGVMILAVESLSLGYISGPIGGAFVFMMINIAGLAAGLLYYYLRRTLFLRFTERGGDTSRIEFIPSVIENLDVDEGQARFVCKLTQAMINHKLNNT